MILKISFMFKGLTLVLDFISCSSSNMEIRDGPEGVHLPGVIEKEVSIK